MNNVKSTATINCQLLIQFLLWNQSVKDSGNSTFFTKRSTLLVKTSRKTKFLQSFSVEQNAKLLPFLSMLVV